MNSVGAIIVSVFAMLWVVVGTWSLDRRWFALSVAVSFLISSAIVFAAFTRFGARGGTFDGRIYAIFVALELIAIILARILLKRPGRQQFLIPAIAFIVGAHFFGMVPAFHANEFWWVGAAMCLLPLLVTALLPQKIWPSAVGLGCAFILWGSVLGAFF